MLVKFNVRGQQGKDFHWRKHYYELQAHILAMSDGLKFKCLLQMRSFSCHKSLIDGLELWGLLVDYCDVFISCLDSYSDSTHSLWSK